MSVPFVAIGPVVSVPGDATEATSQQILAAIDTAVQELSAVMTSNAGEAY